LISFFLLQYLLLVFRLCHQLANVDPVTFITVRIWQGLILQWLISPLTMQGQMQDPHSAFPTSNAIVLESFSVNFKILADQ
jgi:hypothetical protein